MNKSSQTDDLNDNRPIALLNSVLIRLVCKEPKPVIT